MRIGWEFFLQIKVLEIIFLIKLDWNILIIGFVNKLILL